MTTATIDKPRMIIRTNTDGVYYSIPESMKDEFADLNEAIDGLEYGTSEWFDAHTAFNTVFNKYLRD